MSNHDETLRRVAEQTFENLAFMFALADDEAAGVEPEDLLIGKVGFDGPFRGELTLRAPQTDALRELLNVICGNLLPEIAGSEAVFDVLAPRLAEAGETTIGEPAGRAWLMLETGRVELSLTLEQSVPA